MAKKKVPYYGDTEVMVTGRLDGIVRVIGEQLASDQIIEFIWDIVDASDIDDSDIERLIDRLYDRIEVE